MTQKGMTYSGVGVDYDAMDPFKRAAQRAALKTSGNIRRRGVSEVAMSRGESAYLIETPDSYLAHVEEGLGTKNLVADEMYRLTGKSYYDNIAQDTVAMIVNDMITLGAMPISVAMHLAVGSSDWFNDEKRSGDLIHGWKRACHLARCAWGGGETPTLKDVVVPGAVVLSGSAIGIINPKSRLIRCNIQHGDRIVFLESSGIHANGLTLARKIASQLPDGYRTRISDGRMYGEALLDATYIYVGLIDELLARGVDIHYAVNVTGHGWRKLMRSSQPFRYVIEDVPRPQPIFDFIQKHGPVDDREAYANFNMGAGFALIVPQRDLSAVWSVLDTYKGHGALGAITAGQVERSERKRVIIRLKGIEFDADSLGVR